MWASLWRRVTQKLREERGAVLIWWWGAESASDVLVSFGLVVFAPVVFAHERAVLFVTGPTVKPKGPKFSFGIKTLVV